MKHTQILCALVSIICVAVLATATMAAAPKLMSYQGRATDPSGNPVTDGPHTVRFDLFTNATTGSSLWNEQTSVTTSGGLFTHTLGSVTPILESQFRYYEGLWLQVTFDGQVQTPRTQFTSVGYAFHVQSIHNADGGSINGYLAIYDNTAGNEIAELYGDANGDPVLYLNGSERNIVLNTGDTASGSVVLPQNAIEASEMRNEPGVGSAIRDSVVIPASHPYSLCGRTMMAPTDGYVLVTAQATLKVDHSTAASASCSFGVSDNNTDFVESSRKSIYLPSTAPLGVYSFPVSSQALFPITAGSQAYYVMVSRYSSHSATAYNVTLTEVFFPTAYTTVSPPVAPSGSTARSAAAFDLGTERLEAEAFNKKRIEDELARTAAEVEELKKEHERKKDNRSDEQ